MDLLKGHFGPELLLVYVKVGDRETRYKRVHRRNLATDPHDYNDFVQADGRLKHEYGLAQTAALAGIMLWNSGSLKAFRRQIEDTVVPHIMLRQGHR